MSLVGVEREFAEAALFTGERLSLDHSRALSSTRVTKFEETDVGKTGDIGELAGSANSHSSIDPLRSVRKCKINAKTSGTNTNTYHPN